ncbi:MAG: LysE family translocator [Gammaproteobacteria bacterium]
MTLSNLLIFCAVYFVMVASPGPGIAALVARVLGRGLTGIPAFIAGFVVGDLIWLSLTVAGLALLAQTFEWLFTAIKYLGAAYLLFLAYKLWTTPAGPAQVAAAEISENALRAFLSGLAITLGNPKVIIFFMALLPTVVDLARLDWLGFAEIAVVICIGISTILGTYALTAARVRRLFINSRSVQWLNKSTGAVMAGAAVAIAAR